MLRFALRLAYRKMGGMGARQGKRAWNLKEWVSHEQANMRPLHRAIGSGSLEMMTEEVMK